MMRLLRVLWRVWRTWRAGCWCQVRHTSLRRRAPRREPREDNAYQSGDGDWIAGGRDFDGEYD